MTDRQAVREVIDQLPEGVHRMKSLRSCGFSPPSGVVGPANGVQDGSPGLREERALPWVRPAMENRPERAEATRRASIPNVSFVIRHLVAMQERPEFILKVALQMLLGLFGDIICDFGDGGLTD